MLDENFVFEDNGTSIKCHNQKTPDDKSIQVEVDLGEGVNEGEAKAKAKGEKTVAGTSKAVSTWPRQPVRKLLETHRAATLTPKQYFITTMTPWSWNPEHILRPNGLFRIHLTRQGYLVGSKTMIDVTEKGVFLSRHSDILPESVENFKYNWKDIPRLSHQATLTPIERDSASSTDMRLPRKGDRWTNCELLQKRKIIGIKLVMAYVALVKIIIQEFGQKTPSPPADAAGEDAGKGSSTNPFAGRAGAGPYLGLGKHVVYDSMTNPPEVVLRGVANPGVQTKPIQKGKAPYWAGGRIPYMADGRLKSRARRGRE
ncbi:MAG: hypothetical protein Q9159_004838 [Coniocarpon cinnabarinum]